MGSQAMKVGDKNELTKVIHLQLSSPKNLHFHIMYGQTDGSTDWPADNPLIEMGGRIYEMRRRRKPFFLSI